jgi:hypothetical protein
VNTINKAARPLNSPGLDRVAGAVPGVSEPIRIDLVHAVPTSLSPPQGAGMNIQMSG